MLNQGTPKNLAEALANGVSDAGTLLIDGSEYRRNAVAAKLQPHVVDFLAQRFGTAMLAAKDDATSLALAELYESITGKKVGK